MGEVLHKFSHHCETLHRLMVAKSIVPCGIAKKISASMHVPFMKLFPHVTFLVCSILYRFNAVYTTLFCLG